MDKTEMINEIFGVCRSHSWLEIMYGSASKPIRVQVANTMLPEALDIFRNKIGERISYDLPITIEGNIITFDTLKREDHDSARYELQQYGNKI